jgi:hypothetical protein
MNDKNKNTKVTLPLLVYAVIFFLFGPFAVLLLAIGVIGYICFKAKKDSSKNEIFKNGNLSGHNFGDISVDNIVTSIRDNTRDIKITTKPYCHRFEISSFNTPFEPKRGNYEPGNLVDMLEREKQRNEYANPDVMNIKNPFEK